MVRRGSFQPGNKKKTQVGKIRADERCPMVQFVNLVSGKWAIPILYRLIVENKPIRFAELQRAVAPITQKELTRQLRTFEARGLVVRQIYAEVPPRVEYSVTALGKGLQSPLQQIALWMKQNETHLNPIANKHQSISRSE